MDSVDANFINLLKSYFGSCLTKTTDLLGGWSQNPSTAYDPYVNVTVLLPCFHSSNLLIWWLFNYLGVKVGLINLINDLYKAPKPN